MPGNKSVIDFVHDHLMPKILSPSPPGLINLRDEFAEFLAGKEFEDDDRVDELAERWEPHLRRYINKRIDDWTCLSLSPPMTFTDEEDKIITWRHPRYEAVTGFNVLPASYGAIDEWIQGKTGEREFLLVGAIFLKALGANLILATDDPGDGGVDLVGRTDNSEPLRSTFFFVQAKFLKRKRISREILLIEYGKYLQAQRSEIFGRYRRNLAMNQSRDGAAAVYMVITNSEFTDSARQAAVELNILLRSRKQLSFWIARNASIAKIREVEGDLGILRKDLDFNLASKIDFDKVGDQ